MSICLRDISFCLLFALSGVTQAATATKAENLSCLGSGEPPSVSENVLVCSSYEFNDAGVLRVGINCTASGSCVGGSGSSTPMTSSSNRITKLVFLKDTFDAWNVICGAVGLFSIQTVCWNTATPAYYGLQVSLGYLGVKADQDRDVIPDVNDNCVAQANTDQLNTDRDQYGNACDSDDDGDGLPDSGDPEPLNSNSVWPFAGLFRGGFLHEQVTESP